VRWLLLITLFGGIIRFTMLSQPSVWGDEANTYSRTSGSYATTVDFMEHDGFAPLHYELYWAINHFTKLTPWVLRLPPAICGTLQIPAIYFLARQLVRKRTALLAALFTACSAYLIVYSRDAKMYMELWFFLTLHLGGFFWWLRTGRRVAWLVWVTAGLAMGGIHAPGLLLLGLEPIFLLTQPRPHWKRAIYFILGAIVIGSGPAGYYLNTAGWNQQHISWVEQRNYGHDAPELVADSAAAYLFGWNFIQEIPPGDVSEQASRAATIAFIVIVVLLLLCAIPWPKRSSRQSAPVEPIDPAPPSLSAQAAQAVLDLSRPKPKPPAPPPQELAPVSWNYSMFCLGLWLIVPTYGFYCASFEDAAWPIEWLGNYIAIAGLISFIAIAAIAWKYALGPAKQLGKKSLIGIGVIAGILVICCAVRMALAERLGGSVWMPRYLGIVFPALSIAVAGLLLRLPTRPFRILAIAFVLAVNLFRGGQRIFACNEPPIDRVAADVWLASHDSPGTVRTFVPAPFRGIGSPGTGTMENNCGIYYLYMFQPGNDEPLRGQFYRIEPLPEWTINRSASASHVLRELQRDPEVSRVIIWQNADEAMDPKDFLSQLGAGWKLKSEETYPIRMYWTWAHLYDYQRREYVREGEEAGKGSVRIKPRRRSG